VDKTEAILIAFDRALLPFSFAFREFMNCDLIFPLNHNIIPFFLSTSKKAMPAMELITSEILGLISQNPDQTNGGSSIIRGGCIAD
jgi:hypothetical protein